MSGEEMMMTFNGMMSAAGMLLCGAMFAKHMGPVEGIAAALVVYALMPFRPRRT